MSRDVTCDGSWRNATPAEALSMLSCPLLHNDTAGLEPHELQRFRCDRYERPPQLRRWHSPCRRNLHLHELRAGATVFFVGDSLAQQAAKAMACRLFRLFRQRSSSASLEHVRARQPWMAYIDPRNRPHRGRGPPWCVLVERIRLCYITAWPSAMHVSEALIGRGIAQRGDAIVSNENMAHGAQAALDSMRRYAAAAANASTVIGRARLLGVRLLWREKSPQVLSGGPSMDGSRSSGPGYIHYHSLTHSAGLQRLA